MNNEEEIQIKISADTSDLEDSLDKVTKSVENNTKKMEKSFKNLHDDLKKVKDGFNFNTNSSKGIGALNTQLNKLTATAKNVANKVKTTLQNAFNIQGKVKVSQQVDSANGSSSSSSGASQVLGDVLTGSALGSKLQHGMAQMGKSLGDVIKKGIGDGVGQTDGVINGFFNTITKGLERMKSFFTNDIQGKLEVFTNATKQADLLNETIGKTKNLMDAIGSSGISHGDSPLMKGLNVKVVELFYSSLKDASTEMAKLNKEYMKLGQDGNKNFEQMSKRLVMTRVDAHRLLEMYKGGDIDTVELEKKLRSLSNRAKYILGNVKKECTQSVAQVDAQITAMTSSVKGKVQMGLAKSFDVVITKWKQLQGAVNGSKLVTTFRGVANATKTLGNNISKSLTGKALPSFKQIQAKCKEMTSNFLKVGKSAKKMGTDTKKATGMMKSGFMGLTSVLAPYLSIFAVFSGLKTSITSYVDSLETASKFKTVFGEMSDEAESWADSMSSSVAVSKQSLMDGSSNIMAIAKSMGMASNEAYDFATNLSEMAVDLNSFNNIEDGLDRIRSGVLGEYESLKSIGIVLNEDMVQAKMFAMGMNSASNESKMLARQMLIQEQMMKSGAMGNAGREAQGLSAQLKMLKFNFQALGIAIGSAFGGILTLVLPVLNKIVTACSIAFNKLASLINGVLGIFGITVGGGGGASSSLGDAITDTIGGVSDSLSGAGGDLADNMADSVDNAKKLAGLMSIDELNVLNSDAGAGSGGAGSSGGGSGTGGAGGIGNIGDAFTIDDSKSDEVVNKASEFAQKIANALTFIGDNFSIGWRKASGYVQKAIKRLKGAFTSLGQAIEEHLVGFANNGGDRLIQAIGEVSASLTGLATNIGASIVEMVTGLVDHLNPQNNPITRFFIDSLTKVLDATSSFAQSFSGWWDKLVKGGLGHFINVCGDAIVLIGGLLCDALGTAIGWVEKFFNSWIGQAILEGVAGFIDIIATALEKLCKWLAENKEVVYAFAIGLGTVLVGAFVVANGSIIAIVGVITGLVTAIGWLWNNWDEVWNWIKDKVSYIGQVIATTFDYMKTTIKNKAQEIWNGVKEKFNGMVSSVSNILNNMKNTIINVWNSVKSSISTLINAIKTTIVNVWNTIKSNISSIINAIKTTIINVWNSVKSSISTVINAIKTVFTNGFNAVKSTVSTIFNGVKSTITSVLNSAKSSVSSIINSIKTVFTNGFNGAKSSVTNIFNGIKNSINNVMNSAKSLVSNAIGKIKGFFNFKISFPKVPLPHFTIKPSGWKIGDLLKGSIPKLGVSFYAKGGIMTQPTAFGMNGNNVMVGGEKGAEGIIPLDRLWQEMDKQFTKQNQALSNKGNNQPIVVQVTLDGKVIAQSTVDNFKQMSRLGNLDTSWL